MVCKGQQRGGLVAGVPGGHGDPASALAPPRWRCLLRRGAQTPLCVKTGLDEQGVKWQH